MQPEVVLGKLGLAVQASSRRHADLYSKQGSHIISAYTYSLKNKEDVKRVREELRQIGVFWKIRYTSYLNATAEDYSNSAGAKSIYYE